AEYYDSLGGQRVPVSAILHTEPNLAPGDYLMKVTVTDKLTKQSQQLTRKFEVLRPSFQIVRINFSNEPSNRLSVPLDGVVAENRWINFAAVGFDRDSKTKQPDVYVEMRIFDDKGKPTWSKPFTGGVDQGVPEDVNRIPMQFMLALNRPGKFTVELQATDRVSKKTAKRTFAFVVTEQK